MLSDLALQHQRKRTELSDRVARQAARLWLSIQVGNIDAGWDRIAPDLERVVTVGQLQAARSAQAYTSQMFLGQDMPSDGGAIIPGAFTGSTLEGRQILPELYAAATTAKTLIGRGAGVGEAFRAGTAVMSLLAGTIVRDAGNMADKVSTVKRGGVLMARVISPNACSRCAILAGVGHFTRHFERHPHCRCTTIPVRSEDEIPEGVFSSAADYFNSLSKAEQDRVFTKSGAEAIRLGASETSVVNARRGMYRTRQPDSLVARATQRTLVGPDGKPFKAYVTTESRMRFGSPYRVDGSRRTSQVRLMPETILQQAGEDREKAVQMLREFGYIP